MAKYSTERLMSPMMLGDLSLPNRVVMAPMTRARAGQERIPNEMMAQYYRERSTAGLIISEATTVSSRANGWVQSPGIYTDRMIQGWRGVTEAVHRDGGRIFCQLWHCGRASHSEFHDGQPPLAPSAIRLDDGEPIHTPSGKRDREVPKAMSHDEVQTTIADYAAAAEAAKQAGFDGVEVHGANGYLIDTFLQSKTNQREDDYGGDIAKRTRFLLEIVDRVCRVFASDRVGVRISPNGVFNDMGSPDYREQFLYVAEQLSGRQLAYLHVMDGTGFGFHELGEPMTLQEFRGVYDGTLIGNVGYDRDEADKRIADGEADLIAFGRPYIANADLVQKFVTGEALHDDYGTEYWYSHDAEGYLYPPSK